MRIVWPRRGWIACAALLAGMCVAVAVTPIPPTLTHPDYAKLLLAQNGELLAAKISTDQQWRFPRQHILPEKYIVAVTQFEDRYFFRHPGVNPVALGKAFYRNLRAHHIVSGGSTLSMQLARILRRDPPRTYRNKLVEILLALKLEWRYSKQEILSIYASNAPFGGNTVGIGAASWRYFGRYLRDDIKDSDVQISWAEAALLAVLPNSPALIHPGRGRDKLLSKRNRLLQLLYQQHLISENEYRLSVLEPLPLKPKPLPQIASHLMHTILAEHSDFNLLQSTIDYDLQRQLMQLAAIEGRHLADNGVHNLSVVVINNQNLTLSAYLGNVTSASQPRVHGAAVDIAQRPRSTGSILKPLLYGVMLEAGAILPGTLVADIPTNYRGFTPENYDHQYRGAVPARQALAQSLNIPAVRMLQQYGYSRFYEDLKQLGMSTLHRPADDYGLSLILGGAEGNLWDITNIYARLFYTARSGHQHLAATRVLQRQDHDEPGPLFSTPIKQGAAWLTLDAMLDVARPGSEQLWRDFSGNQKIAWKTGTSYGLRDAWAVGSNGKYTIGVWAGNAAGEGVAELSGLKTAAPLLFHAFDLVGHSQWLEKPLGDLKELQTCRVDGYLAAENCLSQISWAPRNSHFQSVSPFYRQVQLDLSEAFRVHGGCEKIAKMVNRAWMVLPPVQEYYWRQHHSEYQTLPPWRQDCIAELANYTNEIPMDIIYPLEGSKIYIPTELSGTKGRVVFKASHRNPQAKLFWHIDSEFIRETTLFHDMALDLKVGRHKLIIVDELGFRIERWFRIVE